MSVGHSGVGTGLWLSFITTKLAMKESNKRLFLAWGV